MKFKVLTGVSFGVVLLGSAVAHIPASWVWQQIPAVQGLDVGGISGTLWQGRASQIRWQGKNFGRLQWDMHVLSLLAARLQFDVRFGQGSDMNLTGRGLVGYSSQGAFAENLLVSLPAREVMRNVPMALPLTVAGNLELTVRDYQFAAPYCAELNGALAWSAANVGSPMGGVNPGPVLADLRCDQGKVLADIRQSSTEVSSEFALSLEPGNRYTLNGWFKPGAEFSPQLGQQLKWLGNPDPKGQYKITYSGRF